MTCTLRASSAAHFSSPSASAQADEPSGFCRSATSRLAAFKSQSLPAPCPFKQVSTRMVFSHTASVASLCGGRSACKSSEHRLVAKAATTASHLRRRRSHRSVVVLAEKQQEGVEGSPGTPKDWIAAWKVRMATPGTDIVIIKLFHIFHFFVFCASTALKKLL